ncbi:MAG TPA: S9 family peptidase [Acidimicrobiales bacterium]|nr:S9 family peptidase [Acidimicrobiales bacterium]
MPVTAPYGSWRSPITADRLVEAVVGLGQPLIRGEEVVWNESRPTEGGRVVPVRRAPDGSLTDLVPAGFSARTLVHEYGGACTALTKTGLLFSNFSDQRVWFVALTPDGGPAAPVTITPEPAAPQAERYADFSVTPDGRTVVAVQEIHSDDGVVLNRVVAFPADGSHGPQVAAEGHDFYSAPRVSPDGSRLCWLSWDHPNMPWDGTTLVEAQLLPGGGVGPNRRVAGGPEESISQPRWDPAGRLFYLSDRTGWWNLYADDGSDGEAIFTPEAEMGGPDWAFGQRSYTFLTDGRPVVTWSAKAATTLAVLENGRPRPIASPWTSFGGLLGTDAAVLVLAASPSESGVLVRIPVEPTAPAVRARADGAEPEVLARSRPRSIEAEYISVPRAVEFPSSGGRTAHALYYPPDNPDFTGPEGELPPLIVKSHGGPTGAAGTALDPVIQYFTSRGLAVVDVDYGGSTGYGREYRQTLRGQWGVVDVDDCVNAALWLADQGEVDRNRLAIRGGSAGGYTTLAALAFRDVFAVGASHYGVADAGALARDTHKFESRYLDGLIGPWPEAEALYRERSPIHHTDGLSCPLILFQGLEDRVVPPDQAEMMAEALRAKGLPFAHIAFPGEQHGFRQAATITTVIRAEVAFYGQVLGFTPADPAPTLEIENAGALA